MVICGTVDIDRNLILYKMEANEKIVKEKEVIHEDHKKNYATKGEALGIGIPALVLGGAAALGLWGGRSRGLGFGSGSPENVNINTNSGGGAPTAFDAWEKSCDDAISLTNAMWRMKVSTMGSMSSAREVDVNEKFGLYKATRDLYDNTQDKLNEATFGLYRGQRDLYDTLNERYNAKFCELDKKLYGMEIANMYQNEIIKMSMEGVLGKAINYADRLDCRNIKGILCLPNTPTVTGFLNPCACNSNFSGGAA